MVWTWLSAGSFTRPTLTKRPPTGWHPGGRARPCSCAAQAETLHGMRGVSVDREGLAQVVREFGTRWTRDAADIETYLAAQVSDTSHREIVGPLLAASASSGVVWVGGLEVAAWGDPDVPEMAFSVTKSVVSVVAGLAFDDGLLVPDQPVHEVVGVPEFRGPHNERITWRHLLQQSSQWEGELWGKPTSVDAQSFREGTERHGLSLGRAGRTTTCG